jgi:Zn-finger nucleic acid-binding protein
MKVVRGRDYFTCEYCTSFHFPRESRDGVRLLGEMSNVDCPVCHLTLVSASIDGVPALHCNKCNGNLVQASGFIRIVDSRRARSEKSSLPRLLNREALKREIACPLCGRAMDTHPYSGPGNVVIDSCGHCALIWLDRSEISVIATAPGRNRGSW